jgi:hypothetical protein
MKMQPLIDSKGKNVVFGSQKKNVDNAGQVEDPPFPLTGKGG